MSAGYAQRPDGIDIPERPTAVSGRPAGGLTGNGGGGGLLSGWSRRRRVLVAGGVAATSLAIALAALLLSSGDERGAGSPGEAPLIKAEDQPIKVSPESPGGMQVPNRDIMVYGRLQGTPGGKPPVERLLPEPEQPLTPPSPKPPAGETPVTEAPPPLLPEGRVVDEGPSTGALPPPESIAPVPEPVPAPAPKPVPDKAAAEKAAAEKAAQQKAAAQKAAAEKAAAQKAVGEKVAKLDAGPKAAGGAYQVQLFAGRSADEAKGAWARLKGKNGDLLGALSPNVARADLGDRGTFYRLRAGPLSSEAQAKTLCQSLSGRGTSCIIIRPGN